MKRTWEKKAAGAELLVKTDGVTFIKTDDQAALTAVTDLQGLSAATRTQIADDFGANSLEDFDDQLQEEEWELRDRLDYYDYPDSTVNITAKEGTWFSPEAVESFCGEDAPDPAVDSINQVNSDFWRHSVNEEHSIVYRLRGYPKKVSRIRFRYNSTEPARERLNDVDVHAAKNLTKIDDAANILETGINITWPIGAGSVWVEHTLAKKKAAARYIKLVVGNTDNANNQLQIREFEVFVETKDLGE